MAPTQRIAAAIGSLLFFPLMFFAGLWVPQAAMGAGLRDISHYTPLGAAVPAVQNAIAGHWPRHRASAGARGLRGGAVRGARLDCSVGSDERRQADVSAARSGSSSGSEREAPFLTALPYVLLVLCVAFDIATPARLRRPGCCVDLGAGGRRGLVWMRWTASTAGPAGREPRGRRPGAWPPRVRGPDRPLGGAGDPPAALRLLHLDRATSGRSDACSPAAARLVGVALVAMRSPPSRRPEPGPTTASTRSAGWSWCT